MTSFIHPFVDQSTWTFLSFLLNFCWDGAKNRSCYHAGRRSHALCGVLSEGAGMAGLASAWAMARRRPKEYRRKVDAATRCSGVCPHTWPDLPSTLNFPTNNPHKGCDLWKPTIFSELVVLREKYPSRSTNCTAFRPYSGNSVHIVHIKSSNASCWLLDEFL